MPKQSHLKAEGASAAGLLRVSGLAQAEEGYGLEAQAGAVERCAQRHGLSLLKTVEDPGITGRVLDRPAVREILDLLRSGAIQAVITPKVDRLGRAARVILEMVHLFESAGATVYYADMDLPAGKTGRFLRTTMAAVAELEYETIAERLLHGKAEKLAHRRVPVTNFYCFGYRMIRRAEAEVLPQYVGRDGELEIVESEAVLVREIFRRFAIGESLRGIAAWGHAAGFRLRDGGMLRASSVRRILSQSAYAGFITWGTDTYRNLEELTPSGRCKRQKIPRPESEWEFLPCPAIVDLATWQAVQERLQENLAVVRGRPSACWLLRGCVFCGVCQGRRGPLSCRGARATRRRDSELYYYRFYRCMSSDAPDWDYCGSRSPAEPLEERARVLLEKAMRPGGFTALAQAKWEAANQAARGTQDDVERITAELEALLGEERQLLQAHLKHGFSDEVVQEGLGRIRQDRAAKKLALTVAQQRLPVWENSQEEVAQLEQIAAELRGSWSEILATPERLQGTYQMFLRVTLFPKTEPDLEIRLPLRALKVH